MFLVKFSDVVLQTKPTRYYDTADHELLKDVFDYLYESLFSLFIIVRDECLFLPYINIKEFKVSFKNKKFYVTLKLDIFTKVYKSDLKSFGMTEDEFIKMEPRLWQLEAKLDFTTKSLVSAKGSIIKL